MPRAKKAAAAAVVNTAERPITEFITAADLADRLGISKSRVYVLARENRLSPPPESVGALQLFHKSTSYTRRIVHYVDAPAPQPHGA